MSTNGPANELVRAPAQSRDQRFQASLRALKLASLLLVAAITLLPTALLGQAGQVLLLKTFAVAFLALFPGFLYLQFLAIKADALYDEYVLNLYRLKIDQMANLPKPPPGSSYWQEWVAEFPRGANPADNVYLRKFVSVYGLRSVPARARALNQFDLERRGHPDEGVGPAKHRRIEADVFAPVLLATALFCVGWSAVLYPEVYHRSWLFQDQKLSGLPGLPLDALRYGFIGAYAFMLQSMVRRYVQSDLKPRVYVIAAARVVYVAALVSALHWVTPLSGPWELALAFFIGFFPELGLRLIRDLLFKALGGAVRALKDPYPLNELDGLNFWWEERLLEEGVEDMQNLTTANLVDLMLNTRVPINRMVDWIDQGFLYIRTDTQTREGLRRHGIRTATDLLDVLEGGKSPGLEEGVAACLRVSLAGEVNLWHIRQWKHIEWLEPPEVHLDRQPVARTGTPSNGDSVATTAPATA